MFVHGRTCSSKRLKCLLAVTTIDKDGAGEQHELAQNGRPEQFFLGQDGRSLGEDAVGSIMSPGRSLVPCVPLGLTGQDIRYPTCSGDCQPGSRV